MIVAARRAEFDFYQKGRALGADRFVATPDAVIKVMLEAALKLVAASPPTSVPSARIIKNRGDDPDQGALGPTETGKITPFSAFFANGGHVGTNGKDNTAAMLQQVRNGIVMGWSS